MLRPDEFVEDVIIDPENVLEVYKLCDGCKTNVGMTL
jgi:hypothetical protein